MEISLLYTKTVTSTQHLPILHSHELTSVLNDLGEHPQNSGSEVHGPKIIFLDIMIMNLEDPQPILQRSNSPQLF